MEFNERIAGMRGQLLGFVIEQLRVERATAEDIVHDALAVCLERASQFEGGESDAMLYGWLKTTAFRRGLRVIDPAKESAQMSSFDASDSGGTPSEGFRFQDARERIHAAIAELPDRQREVITWKYFQNLSTQQIAEGLGITENAVAGLKARAFSHLSKELTPDDFQSFLC
jgi:RNA polymerase sigma factor (sigma-70 family)